MAGLLLVGLPLRLELVASWDSFLYSKFDLRYYLNREQIAFVRPGE